ncbi:MAG: hypothetical protein AAB250_07050, partial [Bdellovibrionota bacterium]
MGFEAVIDSANMAASEELERLERQREQKDKAFDADRLTVVRDLVKEGTLGAFVAQNQAKLSSLVPGVNWDVRPLKLSKAQAELVINSFTVNELFLRNYRNTATTYIFDLNRVVEKFKDVNVQKAQSNVSQSVLRKEFERLAFNYRASSISKMPTSA